MATLGSGLIGHSQMMTAGRERDGREEDGWAAVVASGNAAAILQTAEHDLDPAAASVSALQPVLSRAGARHAARRSASPANRFTSSLTAWSRMPRRLNQSCRSERQSSANPPRLPVRQAPPTIWSVRIRAIGREASISTCRQAYGSWSTATSTRKALARVLRASREAS